MYTQHYTNFEKLFADFSIVALCKRFRQILSMIGQIFAEKILRRNFFLLNEAQPNNALVTPPSPIPKTIRTTVGHFAIYFIYSIFTIYNKFSVFQMNFTTFFTIYNYFSILQMNFTTNFTVFKLRSTTGQMAVLVFISSFSPMDPQPGAAWPERLGLRWAPHHGLFLSQWKFPDVFYVCRSGANPTNDHDLQRQRCKKCTAQLIAWCVFRIFFFRIV
jgi:hypothetical protein